MTAEQIVRNVLSLALHEGLVAPSDRFANPDPQARTAGELAATVNLFGDLLRQNLAARDERWQAAIGCSLEDAEELAESERNRR